MRPGPTGQFPDGKIADDDEGELTVAVRVDGEHIRMEFGKSIEWLAMRPNDAINLATLMIRAARTIVVAGGGK